MHSTISHSEKLYSAGDVINLEDFLNSPSHNNNIYSTISYSKTPYYAGDVIDLQEDVLNSPDLIEIVNTGESSPTTVENLDSASNDNHVYSKIYRSNKASNTSDVLDFQQHSLKSSVFIDRNFSPQIESSSIKSHQH
ncbi:unnamed protein product [Rotaria sp. Silwood2]|nr:unnamed protein product [Rotaria sp. Silwood2]